MNFLAFPPQDYTAIVKSVSPDWFRVNRLYYDGDHFQKGAGWVGPGPQPTEDGYSYFCMILEKGFISQNVIKRVVNRHRDAVAGKEADWGMTPKQALPAGKKPAAKQQALIDEANALLTNWWDKRGAHRVLQDFVRAYELYGRAGLRLFVPFGRLDANGQIPKGKFEEVLDYVFLETPSPSIMHVYTDRDTMRDVGIYVFSEDVEKTDQLGNKSKFKETRIELSFNDVGGVTRLIIIGDKEPQESDPLQLGGKLWHYEVSGEPLVSDQMKSLQNSLNLAKTVEKKNLADNGWAQEFVLNATLPGKYEGEGASRKWVPDPIVKGPNITRLLMAQEIDDGQGKKIAIPASTERQDPVDPNMSIDAADDFERAIHKEAGQSHAFQTLTSNSSGESFKQQRADFETSLGDTRAHYESAGRWLLEMLLSLAGNFAGQVGHFDELRANFEARIDTGPKTSDELRELSERYEKGLLDRETTISKQGETDPAAIALLIDAGKAAQRDSEDFPANP